MIVKCHPKKSQIQMSQYAQLMIIFDAIDKSVFHLEFHLLSVEFTFISSKAGNLAELLSPFYDMRVKNYDAN